MNTTELENRIFELERVRLVIRADKKTQFPDYAWVNKAEENSTVKSWLATRVEPTVGNYCTVVVSGSGTIVHGGTTMKNLRSTYG